MHSRCLLWRMWWTRQLHYVSWVQ